MTFGEYIKNEREKAGIKARALSTKLNKSSSYIYSIEKDLYKPDFKTAYDILKALQIKIDDEKAIILLKDLGIDVPEIFHISNKEEKTEEINYQQLYEDSQDNIIEKLKDVFEQLEDDISYWTPDFKDCAEDPAFSTQSKFLTTFISIMLGENCEIEILHKFYDLMGLPLHKLNPIQFQKLVDFAESLLEYQYVYESGENSKAQKYPHYRVKFKNVEANTQEDL